MIFLQTMIHRRNVIRKRTQQRLRFELLFLHYDYTRHKVTKTQHSTFSCDFLVYIVEMFVQFGFFSLHKLKKKKKLEAVAFDGRA